MVKPNKRQRVVLNHDTIKVEDKREDRKDEVRKGERKEERNRNMQQKLTSTPD